MPNLRVPETVGTMPLMATKDTTHAWDAQTYDQISAPMTRMGTTVLDRLQLTGNETVLDAGCGSGRVTAKLLERLPDGRVIALDGSEAMLTEARANLAGFGARVTYLRADLSQELPAFGPVDAILSTATFHWVTGHADLFKRLASHLRPSGQLIAQWGGFGNVANVIDALDSVRSEFRELADWDGPWWFPTTDDVTALLETAGFQVHRAWLTREYVTLDTREELERYLATPVLVAHLDRVGPAHHATLVTKVADRLAGMTINYVRMNVVAARLPHTTLVGRRYHQS